MNNIIEVKNLNKTYYTVGEDVEVLDSINWSVKRGDSASIIGESGVGKSTLLYLLGLLANPTEGDIIINDTDTSTLTEDEKSKFIKNNIGFIFQFFQLFNEMTLWENIYIVARMHYNKEKAEYKCNEIIKFLELENRRNQIVSYLSGGERQRVAVARALIKEPILLLADEPTGNLDEKHAKKVLDFIEKIYKNRDLTLIMVSHNPKVAKYCNNIYELKSKKISEVKI